MNFVRVIDAMANLLLDRNVFEQLLESLLQIGKFICSVDTF